MNPPAAMTPALRPTADPGWVIDQPGFDPLRDSSRQSRFAVSNGFLGVRAGRAINCGADGVVPPRTYVAGLFDCGGPERPIPALVPAADWLRVGIALPGGPAALNPDDVSSHYRTFDMRRGALLSGGHLVGVPGLAIRLRVLRLVSLSERAIGLQLIQIEVEQGEFDVTLEASFEGLESGLKAERLEHDLGAWRTRSSGKRLAMACACSLRLDGEELPPGTPGPFRSTWGWRTRPGQVACFERMVAVTREDAPAGDPGAAARAASARPAAWAGAVSWRRMSRPGPGAALAPYADRSVPMDLVLGRERIAHSQLVKQADVVALLGLLPEEFEGGAAAANFDYYEPRCSHGSSLSRAMHGLVAARLGRPDMALRFLRQTSAIDLADTHVAIDGGLHIAALGGVWMIAVLGFAGVTLLPDALAIDPRLPAGWTGLTFRCQWRGRSVMVAIDHRGMSLEATLEAGDPMALVVQGAPHRLGRGQPLRSALRASGLGAA